MWCSLPWPNGFSRVKLTKRTRADQNLEHGGQLSDVNNEIRARSFVCINIHEGVRDRFWNLSKFGWTRRNSADSLLSRHYFTRPINPVKVYYIIHVVLGMFNCVICVQLIEIMKLYLFFFNFSKGTGESRYVAERVT